MLDDISGHLVYLRSDDGHESVPAFLSPDGPDSGMRLIPDGQLALSLGCCASGGIKLVKILWGGEVLYVYEDETVTYDQTIMDPV